MGFMDGIGGGGTKRIRPDGRAGIFTVNDTDESLNNKDFIATPVGAKGGHLKFGVKGQAPESHMGAIYPKDEVPPRASLGNMDKSEWTKGQFGDEPEDPWRPVIEIPLRQAETGDQYILSMMSKTALAAAKDFLSQCRRLPEGYEPIVRLQWGSYKGKFGTVKKPILTIVGKVEIETGKAEDLLNDAIGF